MMNIDMDNLLETISKTNDYNKKRKKRIKIGQIHRSYMPFVITYIEDEDVYVLYQDGFSECKDINTLSLDDILAEYPTWLEAVNSKEFKE